MIDTGPAKRQKINVPKIVSVEVFMLGFVIQVKEFIYVTKDMVMMLLHTAACMIRRQVRVNRHKSFIFIDKIIFC